jgi:hypothetical protein
MVLVEILLGKFPELLVEGGREHQVAMVVILVHILLKSATIKQKNSATQGRDAKVG